MNKNTLKMFIKKHKIEIDRYIREAVDDDKFRINDEERRLWVLNTESLYNWAKSYKVEDI
jgi:hypothetical protein